MLEPGSQLETIADPWDYSADQLELARRVAVLLGRGRLVLCEAPRG
jgi:hypothetical protein